jgi:hypothetical protein
MRGFFTFVAGFFRIHAPESSTRLVGIAAFFVALGLSSVLIVRSCTGANVTERAITWTDIVVLIVVFTYACVALNLRSPIPPEVIAQLAGVKLPEQKPEVKVETTTTTSTEVKTPS